MPEFTKDDFTSWLKISLRMNMSISSVIAYEFCMSQDREKSGRAMLQFQKWIERGCAD